MMGLLSSRAFETGCRIEIEQSPDHFHAHVKLDGNIPIYPGDRVQVHGAPVMVSFGEKVTFNRSATVQPRRPAAPRMDEVRRPFRDGRTLRSQLQPREALMNAHTKIAAELPDTPDTMAIATQDTVLSPAVLHHRLRSDGPDRRVAGARANGTG